MKRCSTEPIDRIFVKEYGFLSCVRSISKHLSNYLSRKYSKTHLKLYQKG